MSLHSQLSHHRATSLFKVRVNEFCAVRAGVLDDLLIARPRTAGHDHHGGKPPIGPTPRGIGLLDRRATGPPDAFLLAIMGSCTG